MENQEFLLKAVTFSWKDYMVFDRKFKKGDEVFWLNEIKRRGCVYSSKIEKSDCDKNVNSLRNELFKFLGYKKYEGAMIYGRKN